MDLFSSDISERLYGNRQTNPPVKPTQQQEKQGISLSSFFDSGNTSIKPLEGLDEIYEGYEIPDKVLGAKEDTIPSPFSHRTYKDQAGGRIEVWGNSCKIDSNLNSQKFRGDALWYRNVDEYHSVDEKIRRNKSKKCVPPTRTSGDINGLSEDARRRLIKKVNKVDYKNRKMPYWVTLTYPKRFPTDREEYKADLDTFFKRLKREFGEVEYLWRLEFQRRGAPHYHLILFLPDWKGKIQYLREWVSQTWYEVAQRFWDEKDEKHLKAGTNCKRVKNYRQLISYVSKYMGKNDTVNEEATGRVWGASRNWGDYFGSVVISGYGIVEFLRIVRRYIKSQGSKKMANYMAKNPNTEVFLPWSVVVRALKWIEESNN